MTFTDQLNGEGVYQLVNCAMENGINTFDVAESYGDGASDERCREWRSIHVEAAFAGEAERRLGDALRRGRWRRSDFVVVAKLQNWRSSSSTRVRVAAAAAAACSLVGAQRMSRKHVVESMKTSLANLQVRRLVAMHAGGHSGAAHRSSSTSTWRCAVASTTRATSRRLCSPWRTSSPRARCAAGC